MLRLALFAAILLTAGCSTSHAGLEDSGRPPLDDGGTTAADGGSDPIRCAPEVGEMVGEGCFCPGPAVLHGGVLYRQSIGVEVWDVSEPLAPALAGRVEERSASDGGLGVVDGHLLSVGNFESAMRVYALDDPLRPRLVTTLALPAAVPARLAVGARFAVIGDEGGAGPARLIGVDLADVESPRLAWEVTVEGRVTSVVLDGDRVFAATREHGSEARAWLEVLDRETGASLARHLAAEGDDAGYFADLAMHRGRLLRTASGAVEIVDVDGVEPVVIARHSFGEPYPRTIAVHGDIAAIGGSALVVLDLADPTRPREVGRAATPVGDVRALASDGTHAFASSGNGLVPIALRCE